MEIEIVKPQEIEKRSFEIIEEELKERGIVLPEKKCRSPNVLSIPVPIFPMPRP